MFFWLSFCDPALPQGKRFLGACLVEGNDLIEAAQRAHFLGINPGGEVMGAAFDSSVEPLIRDHWKNRLLKKEECEAMDNEIDACVRELSLRIEEYPPEIGVICPEHNKDKDKSN